MSTLRDGAEVAYPVRTEDDEVITIVKKEYEGQTLVLTDAAGDKWIANDLGTVVTPFKGSDAEKQIEADEKAQTELEAEEEPEITTHRDATPEEVAQARTEAMRELHGEPQPNTTATSSEATPKSTSRSSSKKKDESSTES